MRGFDSAEAQARLAAARASHADRDAKEFIRRYLDERLRERGVVYGTPLASEQTIIEHTREGYAQRRAVFMALQQVQAELALEVGLAVGHTAPAAVLVAELLVCYALFCRQWKQADRIHGLLARLSDQEPAPDELLRWAARLGDLVPKRAYLAGNPLLGLPVHNAFSYSDAKTFCRLAVVYFEQGRPAREEIQRVWDFHDRERALLLQALVGLTQAERSIGVSSRKVMIEQIKSANLPRAARRELLGVLKQPVSSLAVAALVGQDRLRDFLLEQVFLGALLDGYLSEAEQSYVDDLAGWLSVSPKQLAEVEARVVAFYEQHHAYLDMFTVGHAVRDFRQRMLDRLQRGLKENLDLIVEEIRAKQDLGDLLMRASTGDRLSKAEWKEVRGQLLDILRSIPSLAIFTLPGGVVLLPLVFKLLPDGLKPRSFAERDRRRRDAGEPDPDEQA